MISQPRPALQACRGARGRIAGTFVRDRSGSVLAQTDLDRLAATIDRVIERERHRALEHGPERGRASTIPDRGERVGADVGDDPRSLARGRVGEQPAKVAARALEVGRQLVAQVLAQTPVDRRFEQVGDATHRERI